MKSLLRTGPFAASVFALIIVLGLNSSANADANAPSVTAVSNGHVGSISLDGEEKSITIGMSFDAGVLKVLPDQQVMLYCSAESDGANSGGAVIILGPAELTIDWQPERLVLEVHSGRVMASAFSSQDSQLVILKGKPTGSTVTVEAPLGEGETSMIVTPPNIDVAFTGASGSVKSMRVKVGEAEHMIAAGKRITVEAAAPVESDIGNWRSDNGLAFHQVAADLSVKSARDARVKVQGELLDTVVQWDQFAQPANIEPLPEGNNVQPEIRQNVAAVQNAVQNTTNRSGSPQTPNVQGANEVPSLSPGSISVGGVTAVNQNNAQARNLLTQTQSRGLGFNGPSRLATPGFLNGGRTVGPPGLGAQKAKR